MNLYVNRTINLKKIKAIGLDMDYTLVRYKTENFERLTFELVCNFLIEKLGYPKKLAKMKFDFERSMQGLVIDRSRGNILKLGRFGKVKTSYHGTKQIPFEKQQRIYQDLVIDLSDSHIQSLDTSFSISNGVLYSYLVDMKTQGVDLPDYEDLAKDVKDAVDEVHRDGSLKERVKQNIDEYIIKDPHVARQLERYKSYGKILMVITNSDFDYTKFLLGETITPYLENHSCWTELFDYTITLSMKPKFFLEKGHFLSVDYQTGNLSNYFSQLTPGIYQGGNAVKLQEDLGLSGSEILYLGDHIYGDVVCIKKACNWRTALVLEPLALEVELLKKAAPIQKQINEKMQKKVALEKKLNHLYALEFEKNKKIEKEERQQVFDELDELDQDIGQLIESYNQQFNKYWGEMMRAGNEEGRFLSHVEKYACLYMSKVSDLLSLSPRTYFRPFKRNMPHEFEALDQNPIGP